MNLGNLARMVTLTAACVAAVGSASSNSNNTQPQPPQQAQQQQSAPPPQDMEAGRALGLWRSTFGAVKIDADNSKGGIAAGAIHGIWQYQRQGQEVVGYFFGTLRGNVLQFRWQEPANPPLTGEGYLVFEQSGRQYSGRWWSDKHDRVGDWNGWRQQSTQGGGAYPPPQPGQEDPYGGQGYGQPQPQQPQYPQQPQQYPQRPQYYPQQPQQQPRTYYPQRQPQQQPYYPPQQPQQYPPPQQNPYPPQQPPQPQQNPQQPPPNYY